MMVVNYGRNEPHVTVQADGMEVTPVDVAKNKTDEEKEVKVDSRQPLWDKLDSMGVIHKKNISAKKLKELIEFHENKEK